MPADFYDDVEYSPDGTHVLVSYTGANQFYSIFDIARRELVPLTRSRDALDGVWEPDGRGVTYSVGSEVRSVAADGSGDQVIIDASVIGDRVVAPTSWSPDGKTLVLQVRDLSTSNWDIMTYSTNAGTLTPLVATLWRAPCSHSETDTPPRVSAKWRVREWKRRCGSSIRSA